MSCEWLSLPSLRVGSFHSAMSRVRHPVEVLGRGRTRLPDSTARWRAVRPDMSFSSTETTEWLFAASASFTPSASISVCSSSCDEKQSRQKGGESALQTGQKKGSQREMTGLSVCSRLHTRVRARAGSRIESCVESHLDDLVLSEDGRDHECRVAVRRRPLVVDVGALPQQRRAHSDVAARRSHHQRALVVHRTHLVHLKASSEISDGSWAKLELRWGAHSSSCAMLAATTAVLSMRQTFQCDSEHAGNM
eukprot:6214546-Pleurochrysis_carterae.AAC.2